MPVLPGDLAAQAVSDEFAVLDPGVADRMGENGALAARARTGRGEHLDVSMWEKSLTALASAVSDYLLAGRQPTRQRQRKTPPAHRRQRS